MLNYIIYKQKNTLRLILLQCYVCSSHSQIFPLSNLNLNEEVRKLQMTTYPELKK